MKLSYWITLMILLPTIIFGKETSPSEIIRNVEKTLLSDKTVRIQFEQTYHWNLTGEEQSIKGELLLEGDDRFRVTTDDQIMVSNGKTLWTYSKPSNRVLIDVLSKSSNTLLPRQVLFKYTQDYASRVTGEELVAERQCFVIEFTTKTGDVFFPKIMVWVDKKEWVPRKIEQTDINENVSVYFLHDVEIGAPLPKDIFSFVIPDGVDVVEMNK